MKEQSSFGITEVVANLATVQLFGQYVPVKSAPSVVDFVGVFGNRQILAERPHTGPCFEPKLKQSNLWERLWICIGTFDTGTMCWLWTTVSAHIAVEILFLADDVSDSSDCSILQVDKYSMSIQSLSKDLEQQISLLRKSRWVDLSELVDFAMKPLLKPTCQSIQLLGNGSYNTVYKLVFANGTEITASVPVHDMDP
ncbi:hypothetical protein BDR05DRAFT_988104 [Suillus weaverae]|nr:hypothetical protein BDR05DRAFT_988104 [Suillus weaverae]